MKIDPARDFILGHAVAPTNAFSHLSGKRLDI
jgi:hypothetical protein